MARPGRFITFEGGEGTGKSTQVRHLAAALEARNIDYIITREPGGSRGAEDIRRLLVRGKAERWTPVSETLLLFAARADHVERTIKPALAEGQWVICDRFSDSTYAYQGVGRDLDRETIRRIEAISIDNFRPELTFILDLAPEVGLSRTQTRATPLFDEAMHEPNSPEAHQAIVRRTEARFENFAKGFHQRLREAFLDIGRRNPNRCVIIDAAPSKEAVADAVWDVVKKRFRLR